MEEKASRENIREERAAVISSRQDLLLARREAGGLEEVEPADDAAGDPAHLAADGPGEHLAGAELPHLRRPLLELLDRGDDDAAEVAGGQEVEGGEGEADDDRDDDGGDGGVAGRLGVVEEADEVLRRGHRDVVGEVPEVQREALLDARPEDRLGAEVACGRVGVSEVGGVASSAPHCLPPSVGYDAGSWRTNAGASRPQQGRAPAGRRRGWIGGRRAEAQPLRDAALDQDGVAGRVRHGVDPNRREVEVAELDGAVDHDVDGAEGRDRVVQDGVPVEVGREEGGDGPLGAAAAIRRRPEEGLRRRKGGAPPEMGRVTWPERASCVLLACWVGRRVRIVLGAPRSLQRVPESACCG